MAHSQHLGIRCLRCEGISRTNALSSFCFQSHYDFEHITFEHRRGHVMCVSVASDISAEKQCSEAIGLSVWHDACLPHSVMRKHHVSSFLFLLPWPALKVTQIIIMKILNVRIQKLFKQWPSSLLGYSPTKGLWSLPFRWPWPSLKVTTMSQIWLIRNRRQSLVVCLEITVGQEHCNWYGTSKLIVVVPKFQEFCWKYFVITLSDVLLFVFARAIQPK